MDEGISIAELVGGSRSEGTYFSPVKPIKSKLRKCGSCGREKRSNHQPSGKEKERDYFKIFRWRFTKSQKIHDVLFCECEIKGFLDKRVEGFQKLKSPISVNRPLYHGSPIKGLKQIMPKDTFLQAFDHPKKGLLPPLVFLTPDINIARKYACQNSLANLIQSLFLRNVSNCSGSVYRVKTRNKKFAKIPYPGGGIIYISTDPVQVKRELKCDQDEPPFFTTGIPRNLLLLCTGILSYVLFLTLDIFIII
tara:strand:- start:129 stop:878 length:750 start_codon:yes stop_codon:yes gene_type:complete